MLARGAFGLVAGFMLAGSAQAQELGDADKGFTYALRMCGDCHAVRPTQQTSPVEKATPFRIVANTRGMTGTAVAVWLRTPHPTMPNLIVPPDDMENIIAYILSLREKKQDAGKAETWPNPRRE